MNDLIFIVMMLIGFSSAELPTCPIDEVPACKVRCNASLNRPICAVPDPDSWTGNSSTFSSICQTNIYNCACPSYRYIYSYDGPCKPNCSNKIVCPRLSKPICTKPVGSDGLEKTFANICNLSVHNCKKDKQYKYWHTGKCTTENKQ